MDLLKEFPYRVYYPRVGPHHLLLWSHHYDRGIVSVAKTFTGLAQTWRAILDKEGENEPITYAEIDIVSPPQALVQRYAEVQYEKSWRDFASWLIWKFPKYRKLHSGFYPPGVKSCQNYSYRYAKQVAPEIHTDETDKQHNNCVNCVDRYVADWPALYEKWRHFVKEFDDRENAIRYGPKYNERHGTPRMASSLPDMSAPPRDEPVYLIGHGAWSNPSFETIMRLLDMDDLGLYSADLDYAYFFCHIKKTQDAGEMPMFGALVDVMKQERVEADKKAAAGRKNYHVEFAQREADAVALILG